MRKSFLLQLPSQVIRNAHSEASDAQPDGSSINLPTVRMHLLQMPHFLALYFLVGYADVI